MRHVGCVCVVCVRLFLAMRACAMHVCRRFLFLKKTTKQHQQQKKCANIAIHVVLSKCKCE